MLPRGGNRMKYPLRFLLRSSLLHKVFLFKIHLHYGHRLCTQQYNIVPEYSRKIQGKKNRLFCSGFPLPTALLATPSSYHSTSYFYGFAQSEYFMSIKSTCCVWLHSPEIFPRFTHVVISISTSFLFIIIYCLSIDFFQQWES